MSILPSPAGERLKVRLRTRVLVRLLRERELSPHELGRRGREPTSSAIYRWLRIGEQTPGGVVAAVRHHVAAVAEELGVPPEELLAGVVPSAHRGRKVRLRTRVLEASMAERGLSALGLFDLCGEPSSRTLHRWLQRGRGAPDGVVVTELRHVLPVAEALDLDLSDLLDDPAPEEGGADSRLLEVAAWLGPRVYPDLIDVLGVAGAAAAEAALQDCLMREPVEGQAPETWRFVRWSHCQDRLGDGARLPATFARQAMRWAERVGLGVREAPELHCLSAVALEDLGAACVAGLEWMRQALRRGVLPEAIWVAERVLRDVDPDVAEVEIDVYVEVALALARALRLNGHTQRALSRLTDLSLLCARVRSPVLQARVWIELGRVRDFCGQRRAALDVVEAAVRCLEGAEDEEARQHLVQALMDAVYFANGVGEVARARVAMERMREVMKRPAAGTAARIYRLMGGAALDRGEVPVALEHYLRAVDIAEADGDLRESGVGGLNVALAYALLGEAERARGYFERAVAYVAGGGPGPLAAAMVHLNAGLFFQEQGELESATRHLEIALSQLEEAGGHPAYVSRARAMAAETALARGEAGEARRLARLAYQSSLVAESALEEAHALAVHALTHPDAPETALAWIRVAQERLAGLEDGTLVVPRFGVERRCAEARLLAGDDSAREDLAQLARRAGVLSLRVEVARIERLLGA